MTTFIAACISLAPQEWVSAGTLIVASGLLWLANRWITKREDALLVLLERWVPSLPANATENEPTDAPPTQEEEGGLERLVPAHAAVEPSELDEEAPPAEAGPEEEGKLERL